MDDDLGGAVVVPEPFLKHFHHRPGHGGRRKEQRAGYDDGKEYQEGPELFLTYIPY